MIGGGSSGSSGGGGGREVHNISGSSYTQNQHQTNMLLPPPPSFQQKLLYPIADMIAAGSGGGSGAGGNDDDFPRRDERVVQWGNQETRELIKIRGELEEEFTVTKRNKSLWEVVVAKMKEFGYRRTPDQCKCKWKNLVNRYKGKDSADRDNGNQFPFYDELHAAFLAKANQMQQSVNESEAGSLQSRKRVRKVHGGESSGEFSEDVEYENESDEDMAHGSFDQQRKGKKEKRQRREASAKANSPRQPSRKNPSNNASAISSIQEMLQNFLQQQHRIEMQWKESMEKSARERERFELEWRQIMENLQKERIMQEHAWRERDKERRAREESRAERRDALLTTLLKKLIQEN